MPAKEKTQLFHILILWWKYIRNKLVNAIYIMYYVMEYVLCLFIMRGYSIWSQEYNQMKKSKECCGFLPVDFMFRSKSNRLNDIILKTIYFFKWYFQKQYWRLKTLSLLIIFSQICIIYISKINVSLRFSSEIVFPIKISKYFVNIRNKE